MKTEVQDKSKKLKKKSHRANGVVRQRGGGGTERSRECPFYENGSPTNFQETCTQVKEGDEKYTTSLTRNVILQLLLMALWYKS
jgi:hypothetical protein